MPDRIGPDFPPFETSRDPLSALCAIEGDCGFWALLGPLETPPGTPSALGAIDADRRFCARARTSRNGSGGLETPTPSLAVHSRKTDGGTRARPVHFARDFPEADGET